MAELFLTLPLSFENGMQTYFLAALSFLCHLEK